MIRILIVDDHPIVRDALATLLGTKPGFEVVGTTASIHETLAFVERCVPDLMLVDLSLGDGSGAQLVTAMRRLDIETRILIVSAFNDEFAIRDALAAGVGGYVVKGQPTSDLMAAIDIVAKGGTYIAPDIAARLQSSAPSARSRAPGARSGEPGARSGEPGARSGELFASLTSREREIFRLFVAGGVTKQIAGRLFISAKTVETHRANVNRKLGLRTLADMIRFAAAQGIAIAPSAPSEEFEPSSTERSMRRDR